MSRHRNIRNLDEDDYYDDYDDYGDYDEEDGYYDDDEYYLQQQREKEQRQKEEAAKKAKANQLKQAQQKQAQKQQQQTQQNQTNKKQQTGGKNVVASTGSKGVKSATGTNKTSATSGGGGISIISGGKSNANKKSGIALAPPPGLNSKQTDDNETKTTNNDNNIDSTNSNNSTAPIPQMPPNILKTLTSSTTKIRPHLSMVVLGHVDAGKSTITGRLLLQLNHVSSRLLSKYQKASASIGKSSFALAWFTDEDESERERGVTMDVGTKFARLEKTDLTILDAPGHRDFIPNMISGAASADCGLLVIAATTGEFEAGFSSGGGEFSLEEGDSSAYTGSGRTGGQTREHIVLSRGLGVTQFVVAVNKLDAAEPAWSQERFEYIKSLVLPFLIANGFVAKRITFVPVSGLTGVNISKDCKEDEEGIKALKKWYKGPTLIEALDNFFPAKREFEKPLRLIVSDVSSEGKNVTVRGRMVQGFVRMGDNVVVLPVGDDANVARVERGKAAKEGASPYSFASTSTNGDKNKSAGKDIEDFPDLQNCALAGDTVEMALSGIDAARLSPGCVICHPHPSLRPQVKRKFLAKVLVMDKLAVPIIRGSQVLLHMHSIDVPAVLNKLLSSKKREDSNPRQNPRVLSGGVSATVEITAHERLVLEEYTECKALGRFVLRRGGDPIAVGLIEKVLDS